MIGALALLILVATDAMPQPARGQAIGESRPRFPI